MKKTCIYLLILVLLFSSLLPVLPISAESNEKNIVEKSIKKDEILDEKAFPKRPKEKTELKEKRTENEKTYLNPDGTITQEVYLQPIHWKGKDGNWKQIDNELIEKKIGGNSYYQNKSNGFQIKFNKNTKKEHLFELDLYEESIKVSIKDSKRSKMKKEDQKLTYENVLPNVDMEYIVTSTGVKENIILQNNKAPSELTFTIETSLTLEKQNDIILFKDEYGNEIARTEPFFAYDQKDALTRKIETTIIEVSKGVWNLNVKPDEEWLKDEERTYPIIIDPSINQQYDKNTIKDTFVYDGQPKTTYHELSYIRTGSNAYGKARSYLQFDLPQLYPNAELVSARLELNHFGTSSGTALQVYQVKNAWEPEKTTWDTQPEIETKSLSDSIATTSPQTFYMTQLVKNWYSGSIPNYGIMIKAKTETDTKQEFLSSENLNPTLAPKIVITYRINPVGYESTWTFDNDTNLVNGNLHFGVIDTSLNGRGIPISIGRYYNFILKDQKSEIGSGWSLNTSDKLTYTDPEKNNVLRYRESDGTDHYFTKINGEWETSSLTVDLLYDKDSKNFSMIDADQNIHMFDMNGDLISITDSNGNKTIFTRENGLLTKVTDASGRYVNLLYESGQLTEINGAAILTVRYSYDSDGRLIKTMTVDKKDAVLTEYSYKYDSKNRLIKIIDANQNETEYLYDESGRVIANIQPISENGQIKELALSYKYGTNNVIATNPKGIKTKYQFNDLGNTTQMDEDYNESNGSSYRQTKWVWDQNERISKVTDPSGNNVLYTYDEDGNVTSEEGPSGYAQIMKYDKQNNLTQVTGVGGQTIKNYYDKQNNQTDFVDASSASSLYEYDGYGNIVSETKSISLSNNLVLNSGFEKWTGLPDDWVKTTGQTGIIERSNEKQNGNYSAKLSASSNQKASITSEYIPIEGEKTYSFAFQSKIDAKSDLTKISGSIKWYASDYTTLIKETKIDNVTGSSDWTRRSKSLQSPEDAKYARIVFEVVEADAYIDNIQLEAGTFVNDYSYILNGDFENDEDGNGHPDNFGAIEAIESRDGVDETVRLNGEKSLLINGTSSNKYYYQSVNYSGKIGTSIILSANAKIQGPKQSGGAIEVQLEIEYNDGTKGYEVITFPKTDSDWVYQEKEIKATGDYKRFTIRTRVDNQTGKVWFDNISVRLKEIQQAAISDYNLAPNSSFEYIKDGKTANWVVSAGTTAPYYDVYQGENAFIGERSFRIKPNGGYVALSSDYMEIRKKGKDYTATIVAKTESVASKGAYLKIKAYDTSNNLVGEKTSNLINHNGDWKRYIVTLNRDDFPSATKIKALVEMPTGTDGTYLFDAIRFQENNLLSTTTYNTDGNYVAKEKDEEGTEIAYQVNAYGNPTHIQLPKQNTWVSVEYDAMSRISSVSDSSGLRTDSSYDNLGNLENITYYDNYSQKYIGTYKSEYNRFGEIVKTKNPLNEETSFEYDELGQVIGIKHPNGIKANYEYDNVGNLKRLSYDGSQLTWEYQYDKTDNVTKVTKNGAESKTYTYDTQLEQLQKIIYPFLGGKQHSISFGYNTQNQISNYQFSGQKKSVLFEFDGVGEPASMTGADGQTSTVIYDEAGRLHKIESKVKDSTYKTYYEYDNVGQATKVFLEDDEGQTMEVEDIIHDQQGNITEINYLDGRKNMYNYDNSNNLIQEKMFDTTGKVKKNVAYEYDVTGNRTKMTEDGKETIYTYDVSNRMQSINGEKVIYDKNGNLSKNAKWIHEYGPNDEMIAIKNKEGQEIATYEYDENGNRTKKQTSEKTEHYYYIGNDLTFITDEKNELAYEFTRDVQGNLFTFTDHTGKTPQIYTYQLNSGGDVVALLNEKGQKVVNYSYNAYGEMLQSEGEQKLGNGKILREENPFRYASYVYDEESGYYHLKNRYYDAEIGRFISEDPVESDNLYVYAENNPLKFFDENGNKAKAKKLAKKAWTGTSDFLGVKDAMNCAKSPNLKTCGKAVLNISPLGKINKGIKVIKSVKKVVTTSEKKKQDTCNCFTAGTTVLTDNGEKKIEDIHYGDKVLAKDDETGKTAYKEVVGLFQKQVDVTYNIYIGKETITTTSEHPFWVGEVQDWVNAKDLEVGMHLQDEEGNFIVIDKIMIRADSSTVYNFMVEDYHNYYVSNLGIWTHNKSDSCILGNNLGNKPNGYKVEAHHIVPVNPKTDEGKAARKMLDKYGIGLNDTANGVFLPSNKKDNTYKGNATIHQNHDGQYEIEMWQYLKNAKSKKQVIASLDKVRNGLLQGKIKLGSRKK